MAFISGVQPDVEILPHVQGATPERSSEVPWLRTRGRDGGGRHPQVPLHVGEVRKRVRDQPRPSLMLAQRREGQCDCVPISLD